MKAVYKNPKELATKIMDLVDSFQEGLISYEKLQETILVMVEKNEDRIYKNGFMPIKLISTIGEERKAILDEIVLKSK